MPTQNRLAYLALIAVCLFWGTTYLGIRIALEGLSPLYLISIRYIISGTIMLVAFACFGVKLPTGRELLLTALCGMICIGIGNSCIAVAETFIPSGQAALFYTTSPFWMVGLDALLPNGKKPLLNTVFGLLVGLLGVAYLIYPVAISEGFHAKRVAGFFLMQTSAACWVLGSLLQKRVSSKSTPIVSGAVQQVAAGTAVFIPALMSGHLPAHIGLRPLAAFFYLVTIGTIVGYSAFIYSMAKLPVAVVSIYTFVNPIVAVFLGWLIFREPFGARGIIAMLIIFTGIFLVRRSESKDMQRRLAFAAEHELG